MKNPVAVSFAGGLISGKFIYDAHNVTFIDITESVAIWMEGDSTDGGEQENGVITGGTGNPNPDDDNFNKRGGGKNAKHSNADKRNVARKKWNEAKEKSKKK